MSLKNVLIGILFFTLSCNDSPSDLINEKDGITSIDSNTTITKPMNETQSGLIKNIYSGCGYNYILNSNEIKFYMPKHREIDEIKKILTYSGIPMNFQIYSAEIENAVATVINNQRYIIYDPRLLAYTDNISSSYWSSMSILAHEIGHHLSGHLLENKINNHQAELEADKFSGFVLYKMGARLDDAINAIRNLGNEYETESHPNKTKRIEAITNGWNEANKQRFDSAIPPPPNDEPSEFYTYNYKMLIADEHLKNGIRAESEFEEYDYFYGVIKDVVIENYIIKKFSIYIHKTGPDWGANVGNLDGETIEVFLYEDYWNAQDMCRACERSLPALLVPGRRLKFSFVEGMYGGTAEAGYLILTYAQALEGNSF